MNSEEIQPPPAPTSPLPLLIVPKDTAPDEIKHLRASGWAVVACDDPAMIQVREAKLPIGAPLDAMGRAAMQVLRTAKDQTGNSYRSQFATILLQESEPSTK